MKYQLLFVLAILSFTCAGVPDEQPLHFQDCATGEGNIFNGTAVVTFAPEAIPIGGIVAAFANDKCVGQAMNVAADTFAFAIWKEDTRAIDVRGFREGESLSFEYFGQAPIATGPLTAHADSVYIIDVKGFGNAPDNSEQMAVLEAEIDRLENLYAVSDSMLTVKALELNAASELQASTVLLLTESNQRLATRTSQRDAARLQRDEYLVERDALQASADSAIVILNRAGQ